MPSAHTSSARRAPLEVSREANRSVSASFSGTKPSLSQKNASSRKSTSSVPSSSSKARTASSKHRSRFDEDDDIVEEDEDDENDGGDSYEEEEDDRRHSNGNKPKQTSAPAPSKSNAGNASRHVSGHNNANKSILARSNPNASILMTAANTSLAFQNSRVAALARSHAAADASIIMRPRGQGQSAMPASGVSGSSDANAAASASLRVDTSSFEEWMKMATDNKINSTNTWSFALIDYFHDMSLLRNDSGDGSINFQKASCTLDGCVKVWTSRVDSVVVETGKLLSGLQDDINEASGKEKRNKGGEAGEDDDDDDDGDEDGEGTTTRRKKRNKEATLAKNFSQIQIKKFDLEFTVDPLFKKTSADFDEGGAGGLLMNHLGVDSNMRVVFDASDVAGVGGDDDLTETLAVGEDGEIEDAAVKQEDEAVRDVVDLSKLRAKLFNPEDFLDPDNAPENTSELLAGRVICPTLCNFRFSKDDDTPFGVGMDEFNEQEFQAMDYGQGYAFASSSGSQAGWRAQSEEFTGGAHDDLNPLMDGGVGDVDFFAGGGAGVPMDEDDNDAAENDGLDFFDAFDSSPALNHGGPVVIDGTRGNVDGYGPFDPSAGPSSEIVMAMTAQGVESGDGDNDGGMFDYFDRRLMRSWAGPEHWKMSRVAATGPLGVDGGPSASKADGARKESRKSKEPFVIDFLTEDGAVSKEEIFEPAKTASSIALPASARARPSSSSPSTAEAYLLPEDRHFNSKQLLRLFLKPRANFTTRRKGVKGAAANGVDAQYWASAIGADNELDGGDVGADENGMPFDTQFFHDADDGYDANGADMGGMGESAPQAGSQADLEDEDLMQNMQALNRVKPEYVNYAKKAKRVDVKKLKENIWKELGIPQTPDSSASVDTIPEEDETMEAPQVQEVKTFNSVLSGLKKAYPQDKMEEISTSFCFICLLHLANEEGLALSTGTEEKLEQLRSKRSRGRKSNTPTPGDMLLGSLGNGRIIKSSKDDDDLGGEEDEEAGDDDGEGYEEDELRVGKLELLRIVKDPKAYRSA